MKSAKETVEGMLREAGVTIGGTQPFDLQVRDERFYGRVLARGSLGLGEAYMDGWWDVLALDQFFAGVLRARLQRHLFTAGVLFHIAKAAIFNRQTKNKAFEVAREHYDIGNDLFEKMLDSRMVYTCGYWSSPTGEAKTLTEAQEAKLDLVCRKIGLLKGQRVLDIGCGFGSFAKFAAERYGASVVGITVSEEQAAYARTNCAGLPVDIRVQDYRDVKEEFDHVVSLGMFEHVGHKNYETYFRMAQRCLKDGGLFLFHTIGGNRSVTVTDRWIDKYIFPNGMIPSIAQIGKSIENLFVVEDWHNFGADYDKTLMAWFYNFDAAWPQLREKYGERFYRMWKYYLLSCAGAFRARHLQLWQIVLSKGGVEGGYMTVR